jgi:hypothetical protein
VRQRWLLLAAALGLILGVAQTARAGQDQRATLSTDTPSTTVAPPAAAIASGSATLRVPIVSITNPGKTPFGVVVSIAGGAEIGRFAVFPPDQTGDYNLSLSPSEQAALRVPGAALVLTLDLIGPAREPLSIVLGQIDAR